MKKIHTICMFFMFSLVVIFLFGCDVNEQSGENINLFTDGLVAVKKEGKWGYVNQQNEVVIDFIYDQAGAFYQEKAHVVLIGEKEEHFLIDTQGNELLSKRYDRMSRDQETDLLWFYEDGRIGLMDHNEQVFNEPFSSSADYSDYIYPVPFPQFQEGIAMVRVVDSSLRYLKQDGTWLIQKMYSGGTKFSNGYAWVEEEGQTNYYCINKQGKVMFESDFVQKTPFINFNKSGLAILNITVENKEYYRIIDTNGERVHEDVERNGLNFVSTFGNFILVSFYEPRNFYLVGKGGKIISEAESLDMYTVQNNYLAHSIHTYIALGNYVYDIIGNKVLDRVPSTNEIFYHYTTNENNDLFPYTVYHNTGIVEWSADGNLVSIQNSGGIFQVYQDRLIVTTSYGRYNLLDTEGNALTDVAYRQLRFYSDGFLLFRQDDLLYGVFDKDKNVVLPSIYERVNTQKHPMP